MDKFNTIVFEGGAVLGISYIGALRELEKRIDMTKVKYLCGSSVGSIFSLALSLNLTSYQIEELINKWRVILLSRIPFILLKLPWNFLVQYGLVSSDIVREFAISILHIVHPDKNDITFAELERNVIITAINMTDSYFWVASKQTTPNMSVIDAVVYSCTGNIFFTPNILKLRKQNKVALIADGGASVLNYPLSIFKNTDTPDYIAGMLDNDYSRDLYAQYGGHWSEFERMIRTSEGHRIIGFKFDAFNPYVDIPINNIISFIWNFISITYSSLLRYIDHDGNNTILIDVKKISAIDVSYILIPWRTKKLIQIGSDAVINSKIFA